MGEMNATSDTIKAIRLRFVLSEFDEMEFVDMLLDELKIDVKYQDANETIEAVRLWFAISEMDMEFVNIILDEFKVNL